MPKARKRRAVLEDAGMYRMNRQMRIEDFVFPYAKIERLSFHAFNEATDFFGAVEGYRQEHGCYPQRILVDKIYRNRETISWCKAQGIQLTGQPWDDRQRTRKGRSRQRNRSIRISAIETLLRANLGLASAAMGLTASWRVCRKLSSVSSALLCCA